MGMTIDEAVLELRWLKKVNQEILETDVKELDVDSAWIKHWKCVTQALDIAIDTARKYQMMQADYENRLKADIVAMLTEIKKEIDEMQCLYVDFAHYVNEYDVSNLIQQKINELPSVTQEPQTFKWCTDCREYDQEKHCCHRWSKVIRNTVEEIKQEQEPKTGHWKKDTKRR